MGKSRLARRICELRKARRQVPGGLVEVNCAERTGSRITFNKEGREAFLAFALWLSSMWSGLS